MELIRKIAESIDSNQSKNAFLIGGEYYTYRFFAQIISNIRKLIQLKVDENEKVVGLIQNDDIQTYAAIIALWFEGKAYVPLNPVAPSERNNSIIDQANISTIIDSSNESKVNSSKIISSNNLENVPINIIPKKTLDNELAYILFTSGSTGIPKGVPITRANVASFSKAFFSMGFEIDESDRFLQMFDLTFDLSVMSYLIPLLIGASIYTIPVDQIKYGYIFKLIDEQKLTFALMVPSILHYLRPHFEEIRSLDLKYSLFCGEALPEDVTSEWAKCVPKAAILNVYGPTESTIFCTSYAFTPTKNNKSINGVLSIGKGMEGVETVIINDHNEIQGQGESGELCLAGNQLTPNYWKNPEKNKEAFFILNNDPSNTRYYKTGDLCIQDQEGDIMYLGRIDYQIQIQGFRVELGEIEFHAKNFLNSLNVVVVAFPDFVGNTELGMAIESVEFQIEPLRNYLVKKLPTYMIPKRFNFFESFPLNMNGKTDRNMIKKNFTNNQKQIKYGKRINY